MAAVNCGKLWLLAAAVLVAIVDLRDDGPAGNGVLCGKTRRVQTKYEYDDDESSSSSSSGEKEPGDVSEGDTDSGDVSEGGDNDDYRAPKRREKSKSSGGGGGTTESGEGSFDDDGKSRAKRRTVRQQSDRNGDSDHGDSDGDDDDDDDDGDKLKNGKSKLKKWTSDEDEPKYGKSKLKKGAGNRVQDEDYLNNVDKDDDDDENWRRRKRYRKNGDRSREDENKLESTTTIISADFDEVLKYVNREMISFQPKPWDFTKKSNQKLKSKIVKLVNKQNNDSRKDDSGAKITIIQKNRFRKTSSSKKVSNDAKQDKLLMDLMKHVKMLLSILEEKSAA